MTRMLLKLILLLVTSTYQISASQPDKPTYTLRGNQLTILGQRPYKDGKLIRGTLDGDITYERAQEAAKLCAHAILAFARTTAAIHGRLLKQCLGLSWYLHTTPTFEFHDEMVKSGTDIIQSAFDNQDPFAHSAIGVTSLPKGAVMQLDIGFELTSATIPPGAKIQTSEV